MSSPIKHDYYFVDPERHQFGRGPDKPGSIFDNSTLYTLKSIEENLSSLNPDQAKRIAKEIITGYENKYREVESKRGFLMNFAFITNYRHKKIGEIYNRILTATPLSGPTFNSPTPTAYTSPIVRQMSDARAAKRAETDRESTVRGKLDERGGKVRELGEKTRALESASASFASNAAAYRRKLQGGSQPAEVRSSEKQAAPIGPEKGAQTGTPAVANTQNISGDRDLAAKAAELEAQGKLFTKRDEEKQGNPVTRFFRWFVE